MNREEKQEWRDRLVKEMRDSTPRSMRARRTMGAMMHMVRDFVPRDRDCLAHLEDHLMLSAFIGNVEIIAVPPECDMLDAQALQHRRLEQSISLHPMTIIGKGE